MRAAILDVWQPWECELDEIFDGRLDVTDGGSAFLRDEPPLPPCSTGFWVSGREATIDSWGRYWFDGAGG